MSDVVSKDRKALFDSAVSFLKDESIKDAPLLKKIEFLKSKGLTEKEIEIAMKEPKKDGIVGDEVSKNLAVLRIEPHRICISMKRCHQRCPTGIGRTIL